MVSVSSKYLMNLSSTQLNCATSFLVAGKKVPNLLSVVKAIATIVSAILSNLVGYRISLYYILIYFHFIPQ